MRTDGVPPDETDPDALSRYREFARSEYGASDESAARLVSESLTYLKLQDVDMDPLSSGEKLGIGFS